MSQYHVSITTDLIVEASDEDAAIAYAQQHTLYPEALFTKEPVITAKLQRPEDNRLLTQIPNVPNDRLESLIGAMTNIEHIIIVMARTPCDPHDIYTAIRMKYPTIDLYKIAKAISKLKSEGWLNVMKYHVERQLFVNIDAAALATVHNETIKRYIK